MTGGQTTNLLQAHTGTCHRSDFCDKYLKIIPAIVTLSRIGFEANWLQYRRHQFWASSARRLYYKITGENLIASYWQIEHRQDHSGKTAHLVSALLSNQHGKIYRLKGSGWCENFHFPGFFHFQTKTKNARNLRYLRLDNFF